MKLFIVFYLIVLNSAFSMSHWTLARENGGVRIYKLKSNDQVMTSVHQRTSTKIDWATFKQEDFEKEFIADKKNLLALTGVRDWKVKKQSSEYRNNLLKIEIEGTYINADNETIAFLEYHLYEQDRYQQVLMTAPKSMPEDKAAKREMLETMFNAFTEKR